MASRIHHSPVLYLQLVKPQHPHYIRDQSATPLSSPMQKDLPFLRSSIRYSDHVIRRQSYLFTQIPRYEVHLPLCPFFFFFSNFLFLYLFCPFHLPLYPSFLSSFIPSYLCAIRTYTASQVRHRNYSIFSPSLLSFKLSLFFLLTLIPLLHSSPSFILLLFASILFPLSLSSFSSLPSSPLPFFPSPFLSSCHQA